LGTLFLTLGRSSEARDQFALAGATFEGLVRQDAQEPRFQSLQAAVQSQAARLELAVGNLDAARRSWEASLEVLDRLVSRFSDQPVYLETRAASRLQMAGLLRLLGRYDEEVRFYRDVIADYLALQKALPDVPAYRENLALTQTDLGQAWRDLGRNEDAQAVLEQAAPVLHELVLEYPAVPRYDETLAACRDILAQVLLDLNRADEARTKAEAACEAYRRLNSRFPDVPEYRERAAIAQSHLGQVQHRLGESEARASFESSLRDLEELAQRNPNYRVYRLEQAHVWQNLGNWYVDSHDMAQADKAFLAARKLWEELASDETPDAIYNLCRLLLLCPLESVRDIPRGVQLTERLRQLVPDNQHYRSLRAAAHLRAGEFAVAAEELQHLTTEREFDAPQDWFLLCLAQVGMGRAVEAKASFDRGCTSMERAAPGSLELQRLRQEALAALPQP
jgi:tetratricopeptide (TPR) repeat protein